nr:MAG TPA: hypothetical protein [Caudoviricetes sp.]
MHHNCSGPRWRESTGIRSSNPGCFGGSRHYRGGQRPYAGRYGSYRCERCRPYRCVGSR